MTAEYQVQGDVAVITSGLDDGQDALGYRRLHGGAGDYVLADVLGAGVEVVNDVSAGVRGTSSCEKGKRDEIFFHGFNSGLESVKNILSG